MRSSPTSMPAPFADSSWQPCLQIASPQGFKAPTRRMLRFRPVLGLRPRPVCSMPSSRGEPIDQVQTPAELVNHPKFQLLRQLGSGGMGVVFLAEHRMMGRRVAIKVINKSLIESAETLLRFTAEVRAAAKLSHPNIVQAYDAEQAGDLHLLVMEFVEGKNLAELLEERQKPLSIRHASHYARQVAKGLHHAWERKMVHRDIKPHNLMLTTRGQIKILDFGLARMVRESTAKPGLTSANSFMGTPEYVAPEQAADARQADIRADLYSLGCTLYYLLAGRPPFREDTAMKVVLAHVNDVPEPLSNLRSDVPAELWAIINKLLAKNPAERYQTPLDLAPALAPFAKEASTNTPKEKIQPALSSPSRVTSRKIETSKIVKSPHTSSPKERPSAYPSLPRSTTALGQPVRSRKPLVAVGILIGMITVACLVTAIVLRIRTKEGTIVIRDLPADSEVSVDGEKVTLTTSDGKVFEFKISAGKKHSLEVKLKDGTKISAEDVEVAGGSKKPFDLPRGEGQPPKINEVGLTQEGAGQTRKPTEPVKENVNSPPVVPNLAQDSQKENNLLPKKEISSEPAPKPTVVESIADFVVCHGLRRREFDNWMTRDAKSFRLRWLDVQMAGGEPAFSAVAVQDVIPGMFELRPRVPDDVHDLITQDWNETLVKRGYRVQWDWRYPEKGHFYRTRMWTKDSQPGFLFHSTAGVIRTHADNLLAGGQCIASIIPCLGPGPTEYIITNDRDRRPMKYSLDAKLEELPAQLKALEVDNWSMDQITGYLQNGQQRFVLLMSENLDKPARTTELGISADKLANRIAEQRVKGLMPWCLTAYGAARRIQYAVIWSPFQRSDGVN